MSSLQKHPVLSIKNWGTTKSNDFPPVKISWARLPCAWFEINRIAFIQSCDPRLQSHFILRFAQLRCLQMTWFMTVHDLVSSMTSQETNCTGLFDLACPFRKCVNSTSLTHPQSPPIIWGCCDGDQVPREQDRFLCKSKSWELPTAHGALD